MRDCLIRGRATGSIFGVHFLAEHMKSAQWRNEQDRKDEIEDEVAGEPSDERSCGVNNKPSQYRPNHRPGETVIPACELLGDNEEHECSPAHHNSTEHSVQLVAALVEARWFAIYGPVKEVEQPYPHRVGGVSSPKRRNNAHCDRQPRDDLEPRHTQSERHWKGALSAGYSTEVPNNRK